MRQMQADNTVGVAFNRRTHWSVVLEAQGETPAAQEALEKLCRTYWRPIFALLRHKVIRQKRQGHHQGFFCSSWAQKIQCYPQEKDDSFFSAWGTEIFVADEQRSAMAIKRGKRTSTHPLEECALAIESTWNLRTR